VVDVPSAGTRWARQLAGTRLLDERGSRVVLELLDGVDDQQVLHAAEAAGPVREFARYRPPLTETFRHVVTGADR
jgi:ABC-2 type transport system ATP-binding protein